MLSLMLTLAGLGDRPAVEVEAVDEEGESASIDCVVVVAEAVDEEGEIPLICLDGRGILVGEGEGERRFMAVVGR